MHEDGVISHRERAWTASRVCRRPLGVCSAVCLLAVSACIDRTPEPTVRAPPPPLETVVAPAPPPTTPAPPRPARKPTPPTQASLEGATPTGETPTAAPQTPVTSEPMAPPPTSPAEGTPAAPPADVVTQLNGRTQAGVATLLGEPQARDEAAPATIWRYVARDCELDVYFYLDLNAKELRALHYEAKGNDAVDRPQQCYAQLVADRRARIDTAAGADRPR